MDISDLLAFSFKNKASDLHFSSGSTPIILVRGDVRKINHAALTHEQVQVMVYEIINLVSRHIISNA